MDQENVIDAQVVEKEVAEVADINTAALAVITKAEISEQIATAKAYPRSLEKFQKDARAMATLDAATAERMYYVLKRRAKDGKVNRIEGPSIRLAEVAVAAWGNTLVMSRPVAVEEKVVRCQGLAWDLEKNNRRVFEVTRRITTAEGRRFNEDMVLVTQQAASQIAARNAVFGVIPRVYIDHLVKVCKAVVSGEVKGIDEKRKAAVAAFANAGASEKEMLELVGRPGLADVTIDDLTDLAGLLTAIEEGHTTLKAALSDVRGGADVVVEPGTLSGDAIRKAATTVEDGAKPPTKDAARAIVENLGGHIATAGPIMPKDELHAAVAAAVSPEAVKALVVKSTPDRKPKEREPGEDDVPPEDRAVSELFGE